MNLLTVSQLARLLEISPRSIWRMRDTAALPQPVRLGRAVRWRRAEIDAWIAAGCPDVRRTGWQAPQAA